MHVSNWSARRSGPSMTVKGRAVIRRSSDVSVITDDVVITGVKLIEQRGRMTVAVDQDGAEHVLRTDMGDAPAGPSLRDRIRSILDIEGNAHVSTDGLAVSKLKDIRALIDAD